jgi:SAM-dependent methyltransferase
MPHEELKARQGAMWGSGPYERITETLADAQAALVDAVGVEPGERWLDVATGTGAVARLAAQRGAVVTGLDLAPALIETARAHAVAEGIDARFDVGDAESMPYEDAAFDVVVSSFGSMFTPDHAATAGELGRVCRSGGRLGLLTWLPEGGVQEIFAVTAQFVAPPSNVGNPFDWGRREYLEELLGEAFELSFAEGVSLLTAPSGEDVWELFVTGYGPTKSAAAALDAERREEFHRAWVALFEGYRDGDVVRHPREYLLTTGRRR